MNINSGSLGGKRMTEFIGCDRETQYLLPPSLLEWLPEKHLARFVVEIVEQLNLQALKASYTGRGSQPYNPEMLVALLFYGYATGVFSSRQLERSTYDSVAFRYIAANTHPDHDTIATFRKRFLPHLTALFIEILKIGHQMGVLKLGTVSLDGSKVKANASGTRLSVMGMQTSWKRSLRRKWQSL
jgi:transposase